MMSTDLDTNSQKSDAAKQVMNGKEQHPALDQAAAAEVVPMKNPVILSFHEVMLQEWGESWEKLTKCVMLDRNAKHRIKEVIKGVKTVFEQGFAIRTEVLNEFKDETGKVPQDKIQKAEETLTAVLKQKFHTVPVQKLILSNKDLDKLNLHAEDMLHLECIINFQVPVEEVGVKRNLAVIGDTGSPAAN